MKLRHLPGVLKRALKHHRALRRVALNYLDFIDGDGYWGSISEADQHGIEHAIELASAHAGPIVEIGALFGHTSNLIAARKAPERPFLIVESFGWNPFQLPPDAHRRHTQRTIRHALENLNTQLFDGRSDEFYAQHPKLTPSMVFIDADHAYESVKRDIAWARERGCPVITGHDYLPGEDCGEGVVRAVQEAFGDAIEVHGSVWVHANSQSRA